MDRATQDEIIRQSNEDWEAPAFDEIDMSAEIGAYQADSPDDSA